MFKDAQQIRDYVDAGFDVRWSNDGYHVFRDSIGQYLIQFQPNGHCVGLAHKDGETLNGDLSSFYIKA